MDYFLKVHNVNRGVLCVTERGFQTSNCHGISEPQNSSSGLNSTPSISPFTQRAAQQLKDTFKNFYQLFHSSVVVTDWYEVCDGGQGAENRYCQHCLWDLTSCTYKAQKTWYVSESFWFISSLQLLERVASLQIAWLSCGRLCQFLLCIWAVLIIYVVEVFWLFTF